MARTVLVKKDIHRVRDAYCAKGDDDGVHKTRHAHKINFLWPASENTAERIFDYVRGEE